MNPRFNEQLSKWGVRALLVAASLAAAPSSRAADAPAGLQVEAAKALFKQALAARASGDHRLALEKFQGAQALLRSPVTTLEVAKEQVTLGLLIEARQTLGSIDSIPRSPNDTRASDDARRDAKSLADAIKPKIGSLTLVISPTPADASYRILVDGIELPAAALSAGLPSNPGEHAIEVIAGTSTEKRRVTLAEGESQSLTIAITASAPPEVVREPPPTATHEPTPTAITPVAPPATVDARPSRTLREGASGPGTWFWVGSSIAGVSLISGGITGVVALAKAGSLKDVCHDGVCPRSASGDLDTVKSMATVSTVSFVVAGAGATLAIVGWLTHDDASAKSGRITPWIGLGSAGFAGVF
jgi:hypothetical protein